MPQDIRDAMQAMVSQEQERICAALAKMDPTGRFVTDRWERDEGGGGCSRVLQDGAIFEKAGVNVSVVHGTLTPEAARTMGGGQHLTDPKDLVFFATGLSLVLHPHNPMAPTVHANYRYFERGDGTSDGAWWFGGGADLTPSYLFAEDVAHFHSVHKQVCDKHDASFYPRFKANCDTYFHIPHRGETRGVGGIFFDNLRDRDAHALVAFSTECAQALLPAYMPLVEKRWAMRHTAEHKRWQQLRRGRYVEFNLVYDRGTTFGLRSAGRIESILVSLPLTARFEYNMQPAAGSPEAQMLAVLQKPRDWA
jgi:coproporphyrinogen III oxidase